jgi:hypothetical protein
MDNDIERSRQDGPSSPVAPQGGSALGAVVIKAPQRLPPDRCSVFLAGSIDMGKAASWQEVVTSALAHLPVAILNPRRDEWDASLQDTSDDRFRDQVEWELDHLDSCDVIAMYFDPNGPAPISLLELGLYASTGKLIVCCPEGYWRRRNVQIVCARYGIPFVNTAEELSALVAAGIEAGGRRDCTPSSPRRARGRLDRGGP